MGFESLLEAMFAKIRIELRDIVVTLLPADARLRAGGGSHVDDQRFAGPAALALTLGSVLYENASADVVPGAAAALADSMARSRLRVSGLTVALQCVAVRCNAQQCGAHRDRS